MRFLLLTLLLCGCSMQSTYYDQRIYLGPNERLYDIPRRELDRYTCSPLVLLAESHNGWTFDIRCAQ